MMPKRKCSMCRVKHRDSRKVMNIRIEDEVEVGLGQEVEVEEDREVQT